MKNYNLFIILLAITMLTISGTVLTQTLKSEITS